MKMILHKKPNVFLCAVVVIWSIILITMMITSTQAATTSTFNVFQLSVESSQKVEITPTNTGWSVKLYGKTESGCTGSTNSAVDATLTITNTGTKEDGSVRAVTFKVTTTGAKENVTAASKALDANTTSLSYTATSGNGSSAFTTVTIDFADIVQEALGAQITTTVNPGANGTVAVDGTPVTETATFIHGDDHAYTLTATPAEGYEFFAWLTEGGDPLTVKGETSFTYYGTEEKTLTPQFIKEGSAVYIIKGASPVTYYSYLDQAIAAAGKSGTVVVFKDGKAFASDGSTNFTIPSGVTLLIPFDDAYTVIKDDMKNYVHSPHTDHPAKVQYRSLTIPANNTITVASGAAISVGSRSHNFMVGQTGPYGAVYMDGGSNITVQSGANLYAWGYIFYGAGDGGTITLESGATVYESAAIMDYTGDAGVANDLYKSGAMPMRAFGFLNVEVPMTLNYGAKMSTFYHIYGNLIGNFPGTLNVIGTESSCVFQIQDANSSVTLGYKDSRQFIELRGNIALNPLIVTLKSVLTVTMNTSKTSGFPLPSFYDVRIVNGITTMNDNLILMEGATMTVNQGATVNMNGKNLFVLASADDPGSQQTGNEKMDVNGVQFSTVTQETKVDINGKLIAGGGFYTSTGKPPIISSGKTGVIEVTGTSDKTAVLIKTGTSTTLSVPITPAYLHNGDGKTTQIRNDTFTYNGEIGKWQASTHDIAEWTETPATCTTNGSKSGVCSICGEIVVDVIPSPGHNLATATCTEPSTCTICGYTEGEPHGHNWLDPTCTTPSVCTYACGTVIDEPLGHLYDAGQEVRVEPTCTEDGYVEQYCTECAYRPREVLAALGHSYGEGVVTTAPTCEGAGVKTYTCSACGGTKTEDIANLGHTNAAAVEENRVESTCSAEGSYDSVVYCSVCDEEVSRTPQTIEKKAHTEVIDVAVAPTCSATGLTEGKHCSVCSEVTLAQTTVEKLPHTYDNVCDADCNVCSETRTPPHAWQDATCTAPKTCSGCGATEGEALGHTEESIPAVAPTCTATGLTEGKQCTVCNTVTVAQTDVAALGHTSGEAVTESEKAATCTVAGSYDNVVYCTVCKVELSRETVTVGAIGHNYTAVVTAPTCTADGYTTHTCSKCNDTYTDSTVAATGHTLTQVEAKAPTCTDAGYEAYEYCSACDYTTYKEVAATGHTYESTVTAPTCTDKGYTTHTCATCGDTYVTDYVDAKGHTAGETVVERKVNADCENAGSYDNVVYCSVCGEELSRETVTIDALGHTAGETIVENEIVADCENAGSYDNVIYCSVCEDELSRETVTVDALGHDYKSVVTAPDFGQQGYTTHTCSRCGNSHVDSYVDALVAVAQIGEQRYESLTKAIEAAQEGQTIKLLTDVEFGVEEPVVMIGKTLDLNGHSIKAIFVGTLDMNGGKLITADKNYYMAGPEADYYKTTDAVLTIDLNGNIVVESGTMTVERTEWWTGKGQTLTIGEKAKFVISENTTMQVLSTVIVEGTVKVDGIVNLYEKDASIVYAGELGEHITTTAGDKVLYADRKYIVHDHTAGESVVKNNVAPNCTTEGSYDSVVYCSVCEDELSRTKTTVDALGHDYKSDVTAPTCEADGYTTHTCSRCNDTYIDTPVDKLGHDMQKTADEIPAQCEVAGKTAVYTCANECGKIEGGAEIPALGHKYDADVTAPTCTDKGYTTHTCATCGDTYVTDYVDAKGHTAGETVVERKVNAGCENAGSYDNVIYCSVCGDELSRETVTVDSLGHQYDAEVTAPTCTNVGYTTYTCSVCGDTYKADEVAATGHSYSEEVTKAATCTEAGVKTFTCSICGDTYTEAIEATGHTLTQAEAKAPTCTEAGYEAYEYCTACDYTTYKEIASTGHKYNESVTTASTCKTEGVKTLICSCGDTKTEALPIDSTNHENIETTEAKAPACEKDGWFEYKYCTACSTYVVPLDTIPATGHDMQETAAAVDATCEAAGKTAVLTCANGCGKTEGGETITALGHSYDNGVVTTKPTCTNVGVKTFTCGSCGDSYTETISAAGHTVVVDQAVAPTCTATGLTEGSHCDTCGEVLTAQTVVNVTEHSYVDGECAVCGAKDPDDKTIDITVEMVATNDFGAQVTAPDGGWKEGTNVFQVSCDKACVVVVSYDGGATYVRLAATATASSNTHSFTAENMTSDTFVKVLLCSDVNMDGKINAKDVGIVRQYMAKLNTLDDLALIAIDVNNDGKVNAKDVGLMRQYQAKIIAEFEW